MLSTTKKNTNLRSQIS